MKADTWDGGHRIPCIAKWPGRIAAGSTCGELVCLMDLMATAAAMIGQPPPDGSAQDSFNILPYLLCETPDKPIRQTLVHHGLSGLFGIRHGDWKLIDGPGSGGFSPDPPTTCYDPPGQLYNMRTDIRERRNQWSEQPDIVHELQILLAGARRRATALPYCT